ncbi:hypothetical protein ACQR16_30975 [Bradyrhizobium oligotrophicum]|uniref:hypothetical protein n=1 Tax=Bradyrhizobium oligotrophicum TaxID=44255 RepID=UPI003EBD0714
MSDAQADVRRLFWQTNETVCQLGGMLAEPTPRESILLGAWLGVYEMALAELREAGLSDHLESVAFFAIDTVIQNAWAIRSDSGVAVAISRGLVVGVADALVGAFADIGRGDNVYPFGLVDMDDSLPDELREALMGEVQAPGLVGDRGSILHQLYCHIASIVIHHELGHVVRGHFDLLGGGSKGLVDEVVQLSAVEFGNERIRFLEFDADAWALDAILQGYAGEWSAMDETARDMMFSTAFAAIVVGQILDVGESTIDLQSKLSYPPPVWRALFVTDLLVEEMVDLTGSEREVVAEPVFLAWSVAARVAKHLGRSEGRWRAIEQGDVEDRWQLAVYADMRAGYIDFMREFIPMTIPESDTA